MSEPISGVFTPPTMGRRYTPYPITQRGTLTIGDDGLGLHGTRASGRLWIGILAIGAIIAGFILMFSLGISNAKLGASIVIACAMLGGSVGMTLSRALSRKPHDITIPWQRVKAASLDGGELQLLVRLGFLRTLMVHFTYDKADDAQRVVDRVRAPKLA